MCALLKVELHDPGALRPADLERWTRLARAAAIANPFQEPPFVVPAVEALDRRGVRLLAARADDGWAGAWVLQRSLRRRPVPGRLAAIWPRDYGFFGTPLLARGQEQEALTALLDAARRRVAFVCLERVPADGAFARILAAAVQDLGLRAVGWSRTERAVLRRRETADYAEAALSAKRRRELGRQRRAMSREVGGELVTTDRAGDPAAVEEFLALERESWKGRAGTAMASAGAAGFFAAMCAGFAGEGRLQLLSLSGGGRTVAMKCDLISGDTGFGFKNAHDETLSRWSPGILLELDSFEAFHRRPALRLMDSCAAGSNDTMNRLWPDRRAVQTVILPGGGLAGRAAPLALAGATAVRRARGG